MKRSVLLVGINLGLAIVGTPPTIVLGTPYSFTFKRFAGSAPYAYTEVGTMPAGITFTDNGNGTATIAGTATTPGASPITVSLVDGARNVVVDNYVLNVQALPLILTGSLPPATIGVAITPYAYSATGGYGGYTFTITAGALPTGLSMSSSGVVTGTPTAGGPFSWTVHVVDSHSQTVSIVDSTTVGYATLTLTGTYPSGAVGTSYSHDLTIAGGHSPYALDGTLGVISGTLPAGLSLSIVGSALRLSGTPTTSTTYAFTVGITSSDGQSANSSQSVAITVVVTGFDPANSCTGFTFSNSNQTASTATGTIKVARTQNSHGGTDKACFEIVYDSNNQYIGLGLVDGTRNTTATGVDIPDGGTQCLYYRVGFNDEGCVSPMLYTGSGVNNDNSPTMGGATMIIINCATGNGWIRHSWKAGYVGGGDPVAGTTPTFTFPAGTTLYGIISLRNFGGTVQVSFNGNAGTFINALPSGFTGW